MTDDRPPTRSLREAIFWGVMLAASLPVLLLLFWSVRQSWRSHASSEQDRRQLQATVAVRGIEDLIETVEAFLLQASGLGAADEGTIAEQITALRWQYALSLPVAVLAADGSVLAVYGTNGSRQDETGEARDDGLAHTIARSPHAQASNVQWSLAQGPVDALSAGAPFAGNRRIVVYISAQDLFAAAGVAAPRNGAMGLLLSSGQVFWSAPADLPSHGPAELGLAPTDDKGQPTPVDVNWQGERWLGASTALSLRDCQLLLLQPAETVFGPMRRFTVTAVGAFLAFMVLAAVVAWLLADRLTRPLRKLQARIAAIASGSGQSKPLPRLRFSEFRRLHESIEILGDTLRDRDDSLQRLRTEFSGVFEGPTDGLFICRADQKNRRMEEILSANTAACSAAGQSRDQLLGQRFDAFFESPVSASLSDELRKVFTTGSHLFEAKRADAQSRYPLFEINAHLITHADSEKVVLSTREITHHRQTEEALLEAKESAESITQATADFNAMLRREIHGPLDALSRDARALARELPEKEAGSRVRAMADTLGRLFTVVDEILVFVQLKNGSPEVRERIFDLRDLFDELVAHAQLRLRGKPDLHLESSVAPGVPRKMLGDRQHLHDITAHLISHLVHHCGRGRIGIDFRIGSDASGKKRLVVEVNDEGPAIPPWELDRIWYPFRRGSQNPGGSPQGSGFELAIAQRLAHAVGARLSVSSEVGKGTRFTLEHPLVTPETRYPDVIEGEPSKLVFEEAPRIICAEDNPANRAVLAAILRKLHLQVNMVEHGQALLQQLREQPFDLALMDLQMPVLDGIETSRRIRSGEAGESHRDLYIAALTAHTDESVREECFAAGMNDFLSKPVRITQLREAFLRYQSARLIP